jgi:hypothetical protein
MVIVGMCASYRHMAAGPTTQKFRVAPDQGAREGGGADLVLRPIPTQWDQPNRIHCGHGLIHITHQHLLISVFLKFPPFAIIHWILEIGAIFLIFLVAFGWNRFFVMWWAYCLNLVFLRDVLMWICDFLRTGQHVVLCSLYSEQSKPPTDVKQFFYHLLFPGFDSLLSTFCSADTLLWTRPARGDRCLGCFSFDSFVYKNITVPSVSSRGRRPAAWRSCIPTPTPGWR